MSIDVKIIPVDAKPSVAADFKPLDLVQNGANSFLVVHDGETLRFILLNTIGTPDEDNAALGHAVAADYTLAMPAKAGVLGIDAIDDPDEVVDES